MTQKEISEYELDDKDSIISILKTMPLKIKRKAEEILAIETKKGEMLSRNKTIHADISREVANETTEIQEEIKATKKEKEAEGYEPKFETIRKKRYKNDTEREASTNIILSNHKNYNNNNDELEKLTRWINENTILLSYLKRLHNSACYLAMLIQGK